MCYANNLAQRSSPHTDLIGNINQSKTCLGRILIEKQDSAISGTQRDVIMIRISIQEMFKPRTWSHGDGISTPQRLVGDGGSDKSVMNIYEKWPINLFV